ncbi:MAG: glycosyltransferase family 2 protein [Paracoccus sp. (in: a-proteobacteria)]
MVDELYSNIPQAAPPVFSIVIPAYNRADRIGRALSSCFAQTFAQFEIVVVDDGSRDGTAEVVEGWGDPRIRCLRQANAGASTARNRGARAARGQYIAFLDSDDEFMPDKLERCAAAIAAWPAPTPAVWYSPLFFHRGDGNRLVKPGRAIAPGERIGDYLFADEGLMQTSTLIVPRGLFLQVGFDESLRCLEDLDLCLRLEEAGAIFRMLPEPLTVWYDDQAEGRLSYTTSAREAEAWLGHQQGRLSAPAESGFQARFLVPEIARAEPMRALSILRRAVRYGGLSRRRAAAIMLRACAPGTYRWLRDSAVRMRHVRG